jgi:hypothetical protein
MGANPWHYFTPYRADLNAALQNLKEQEFRAGRYGFDYEFDQIQSALQGAIADFSEIPGEFAQVIDQPKPSADELIEEYGSLQAAMEAVLEESAPDGTQSILDMIHISDQPEICAACPLSENELQEIFQTTEPTREAIEAILLNEAEIEDWAPWEVFWENIGRGEGRYIIVYGEGEGEPIEIFFAGYSFD